MKNKMVLFLDYVIFLDYLTLVEIKMITNTIVDRSLLAPLSLSFSPYFSPSELTVWYIYQYGGSIDTSKLLD